MPGVKQDGTPLRARALWMKRDDQIRSEAFIMIDSVHDAQSNFYRDQVVSSRILILVPCKTAACIQIQGQISLLSMSNGMTVGT